LKVAPALVSRTVLINGVSKAYAMTGWRLGYAAGPLPLIQAMEAVQSHSTSNPSSISQAAAIAALNGDQACVSIMRSAFKIRHSYLIEALNSIEGIVCAAADGAFYLLPNFSQWIGQLYAQGVLHEPSDIALSEWLLQNHGIALAAGSWFGVPNHLRISFAASDAVLTSAIESLKIAHQSIQNNVN
jgi:aspartate aminotransferase